MLSKRCREHLKEADESALQHMRHSLGVAIRLQLLVPVVIIHAIAPGIFTKTASNAMKDILANR
jgi:TRAP-type C4-dicarboxylate transport system permease large subunit